MKHYLKLLLLPALFLSPPAHAATSVPFTVNMSEAVTVSGCPATCPRIAVDVGGVTRYAAYSAGSGTSTLTFTYDMVAGDVDLDGVTVSSPVDLNGGSVTDLNGNAISDLTFTPPNTANVKVNYPSLGMDFVQDADGRYTLNGTVYNDLSSFLTATGGTFSRNSIGTYYDSTGTLQTATAHTPRFDHDPVTHAPKGILIEESRTNSATFPPVGSGWRASVSNANHTGLSSDSSVIAPDGRFAAIYTWTTTAVTGQNSGRVIGNNIARTIGQKAVLDVYIGANLGDTSTAIGILSSVTTWGNNSDTIYSILSGPGTFAGRVGGLITINNLSSVQLTRIRIIRTATTTENFFPFWYPKNSGALQVGTASGMIAMPQFEAGDFSTSYIPTTNAAVTRQADILTVPTSGWFNAGEGGLYFSGDTSVNNTSTLAALSAGTSYNAGNGFLMRSGSFNNLQAGGNCCAVNIAHSHPDGVPFKVAASYAGTNHKIASGAVTSSANTNDFTGAGTTTLLLGDLRTTPMQPMGRGHVATLKYYPLSPTITQLQLLTQ